MNSTEKFHVALAKIMTRSALRLFGCMIYKFDIKLMDDIEGQTPKTACCYINRSTKKPTILFYKQYINTLTVPELMFDILHEMVHFIDGHLNPVRIEKKDFEIFNLAADHIINSMLEEDSHGALKDYISAPSHTHFQVPFFIGKKCTLNEVYEWLMNNIKRINITINGQTGQGNVTIDGKNVGNINLDLSNDPNAQQDSGNSQDNENLTNELKDELRSIINNVLEQNSSRGSGNSKIYEYIKEITKLEIPWTMLLENAIESTLSKSNQNLSWRQPRKRLRVYNIILPDKDKEFTLDALYVLQDTSGSVSTKNQEKFVNIIEQSINFFSKVIVIQHENNISNILELDKESFQLNRDKIFEIYGRGGTSHKDCFNYIENKFFEDDEKIALIIILSDFESDIIEIWNNYKFHEYINIKVLCTISNKVIANYVDNTPIYINDK